jgi:hypothetical protein
VLFFFFFHIIFNFHNACGNTSAYLWNWHPGVYQPKRFQKLWESWNFAVDEKPAIKLKVGLMTTNWDGVEKCIFANTHKKTFYCVFCTLN